MDVLSTADDYGERFRHHLVGRWHTHFGDGFDAIWGMTFAFEPEGRGNIESHASEGDRSEAFEWRPMSDHALEVRLSGPSSGSAEPKWSKIAYAFREESRPYRKHITLFEPGRLYPTMKSEGFWLCPYSLIRSDSNSAP